MRGGSMPSGAPTSGSTGRLAAGTRRVPGGGAKTSTVAAESNHERDADAGRRDDGDDLDADVRPELDCRSGIVPRDVVRDDGGDDAAIADPDVVAAPASRRPGRRGAALAADGSLRSRL